MMRCDQRADRGRRHEHGRRLRIVSTMRRERRCARVNWQLCESASKIVKSQPRPHTTLFVLLPFGFTNELLPNSTDVHLLFTAGRHLLLTAAGELLVEDRHLAAVDVGRLAVAILGRCSRLPGADFHVPTMLPVCLGWGRRVASFSLRGGPPVTMGGWAACTQRTGLLGTNKITR